MPKQTKNIIDESMLEILTLLKQKYLLFALTNDIKEWILHRINTFNLKTYFNLIISSSDIGFAKPDKRMYHYLITQLNLPPEEILFIDNREENLKPAEGLGMKTFQFKNREEFKKWLISEKII